VFLAVEATSVFDAGHQAVERFALLWNFRNRDGFLHAVWRWRRLRCDDVILSKSTQIPDEVTAVAKEYVRQVNRKRRVTRASRALERLGLIAVALVCCI
jgi:hypothetical protein